ncbi:universal stress protein [Pseudonocardia sp. GCM10023141]|uniref:universal stress protein n=1 Tax=Pseudonocardia sp. GCM10023141 TaxID=3252653 RepID=UPI0036222A34
MTAPSTNTPPDEPAPHAGNRIRIAGPRVERTKTVLVLGHSRHSDSDDALTVAVDLAARLHAHLHIAHGINLDDYPIDPDAVDWDEQARRVLDSQHAQVVSIMAQARDVSWTYHAGHGDPVELIRDLAEEHDALMVIVGSRGDGARAAIERLLSGSVSRGLLRHQDRPVLIVPAGDPPADLATPTSI